ncbi:MULTISPECIES: GNAT family N-acetyltransferase [Aerococcus]|uniref:N-acetyltransferase n=2 Tax=Aerococcus TaxID=1375 RepID=A0A178HFF4_9LACT|nr:MULTISPECIES: GNAT family protein [Aerococcus]KAA9219402.1 GNAT family N-acetyltransferase [Aerococcus loyolae]KAA9266046.1 GNAT family N-acetyltransferase [Aerococcus loyolae]MCY3025701.1 GNAT family N-acetyltransferase [Aerococcus loyolae]MCY3028198.1 GNAT family N-acetyltransferase [Aerococcus loyolae]MCY3029496.1 GNAT family N-acetyltransferase [Aerococcus loyolae]
MKREEIQITLVDAEQKHAKALLDFYKKVGGESDFLSFTSQGLGINQEQEQRYLKSIQESLNNRVLIALLDDEIIGVASIGAPEGSKEEHVGELGISILRRFWSLGLSHVLMEDMLGWAKESPILRYIRLEVNVNNVRAIKLYEKFHFEELGRIPGGQYAQGDFQDTLIMGLSVLNDQQVADADLPASDEY